MNILDIITKKKDNGTLTREELEFAFMGYLENKIPNYQISALLMAIVLNGMDMSETLNLTDEHIIAPNNSHLYAAMGSAIMSTDVNDAKTKNIQELIYKLQAGIVLDNEIKRLPPLFNSNKCCIT